VETLVFPLAVMCGLGLGGVALSIVAIAHAKSSARYFDRRSKAAQARLNAELASAKEKVSELEGEVCQMREQSPQMPSPPRPGFNLTTRSQALRMYRRGDSPGQIASTLQVPLEEVELLLKVHRIALQNLVVTARPQSARP
jgi:hypothetical protein